jgi:hypothetical protein
MDRPRFRRQREAHDRAPAPDDQPIGSQRMRFSFETPICGKRWTCLPSFGE